MRIAVGASSSWTDFTVFGAMFGAIAFFVNFFNAVAAISTTGDIFPYASGLGIATGTAVGFFAAALPSSRYLFAAISILDGENNLSMISIGMRNRDTETLTTQRTTLTPQTHIH